MPVTADYSVTPTALGGILESMVGIRQPVMVWGAPGVGKSYVAQATASKLGAEYIDVRALLMDTVDFRGIPHLTPEGTTRWAPPDFLPAADATGTYLINLEELPAAPPSVQAALYQLILDRAIGEYRLPPGAAVIACGNRESDRAVSHRMPTALASRFVHIDVAVDVAEWCEWGVTNGLAAEVVFFLQFRPDLLHNFDPRSKEQAFACPRTWEFVSRILEHRNGLSDEAMLPVLRGTVGEGPAVEFAAFLAMWGKLPHPATIIADPENAPTFEGDPQTLIACCGAVYRMADDTNFDSVVTYAKRIRPEVGEFLISSAVKRSPELQNTRAFVSWVTLNKT